MLSVLNRVLSILLDLEFIFTIVLQLLPKRIDWQGVEQEQTYSDVVSAATINYCESISASYFYL